MNDVGDAANTNNTQQTEIAIGDTAISRIEKIHTETLDMSRTSKVEQQLNINISQTPSDSFAMLPFFSLPLALYCFSSMHISISLYESAWKSAFGSFGNNYMYSKCCGWPHERTANTSWCQTVNELITLALWFWRIHRYAKCVYHNRAWKRKVHAECVSACVCVLKFENQNYWFSGMAYTRGALACARVILCMCTCRAAWLQNLIDYENECLQFHRWIPVIVVLK